MIKVIGSWEQGYNYPLLEVIHWEMCLRPFGVADIIMSPISSIDAPPDLNLIEVTSFKEAIDSCAGLTKVFVCKNGETDIEDFIHPENVVYIFGKCGYEPISLKQSEDLSLSINIPALLFSFQAAPLVLYDRLRKTWQ